MSLQLRYHCVSGSIFLILTQTYFSQAPARWEDPKENNTNPPRLPGRKIKFLAPFSDPIVIQNQKLIGFYRGGGFKAWMLCFM